MYVKIHNAVLNARENLQVTLSVCLSVCLYVSFDGGWLVKCPSLLGALVEKLNKLTRTGGARKI